MGGMATGTITIRPLATSELRRVDEIDRTERIEMIYAQRGTALEPRPGDWSSPAWDAEGDDRHSVLAQQRELDHLAAAGGRALGAFDGGRLVGLGVVVPDLRPGVAHLAYLYVTHGYRDAGIGRRLCDALEAAARQAGDSRVVVSATPSHHTVSFYRGRGYEPMAEPVEELYELEPHDVHLEKEL
jgi:GNAT superfamily N-acetyltransferase